MLSDALITNVIREMSRRYLSFGDSPHSVTLPKPDPQRRYLLYLHVPFCVVLCPFCSFHRVEFKQQRAREYFAALRMEIQRATDAGYRFREIYVGGGTPTVLPDELSQTIAMLRSQHDIECVSIETNPDDLSGAGIFRLDGVEVNRVSVGVQSFDDALLREMQRFEKYGSGEQIRERLKASAGQFDTLNVDMIFNLPHQTAASLQADLAFLTEDVAADQVSYYPLMTTPSTRKSMLRNMGSVDFSREKEFYRQIVAHMQAAGYRRSSAWCFSRKADMLDEYITEQDQYLGLGSGAFSFLNGKICASTFSINHYIRLAESGQTGMVRQRTLQRVDQMRYYLLTHLFSGAIDLRAADQYFDGSFRRSLRAELSGLKLMGAVRSEADLLRLTERGYYLWVIMMREFFTGVNQLREEMRQDIASEVRFSTIANKQP
jgi:coproporphyrinogen III oxidase-like Fe-S oxidoreductase